MTLSEVHPVLLHIGLCLLVGGGLVLLVVGVLRPLLRQRLRGRYCIQYILGDATEGYCVRLQITPKYGEVSRTSWRWEPSNIWGNTYGQVLENHVYTRIHVERSDLGNNPAGAKHDQLLLQLRRSAANLGPLLSTYDWNRLTRELHQLQRRRADLPIGKAAERTSTP